jgi:integrase
MPRTRKPGIFLCCDQEEEGMKGHAEKRGKGVWRLKVYLHTDSTGKQRYASRTVHCDSNGDADVELRRFIDELEPGRSVPQAKMTVAQYLKRWQRWRRHLVSAATVETQARIIRLHIEPHIGHRRLDKLTTLDLELLYTDLRVTLAEKTIAGVHALLHKALVKAVAWKLIRTNPADAVELKRGEQRRLELPTMEQVNAAIKHASPVIGLGIMLIAGSGIRRGELLALRWEDADLAAGVIDVHRNLQRVGGQLIVGKPKSKQGSRKVTLPVSLVAALTQYRQWQRKERLRCGVRPVEDLVIHNRRGQPFKPTTFSAAVKLAGKHAGIQLGPHTLRHYHATLLLGSGINARALQERLGHANVNTTLMVYSHVLKSMEDEAARAAESAVSWECSWE